MDQSLTRQVAYWTVIVLGFGWIGYIGSGVLMPLVFATIFALFLYPVDRWLYSRIGLRWLTITLSFLAVLVPLVLLAILFSMQLSSILDSLPAIGTTVKSGAEKAINLVNQYLPYAKLDSEKLLTWAEPEGMAGPLGFLSQGVATSSAVLVSASITGIYTFLILYYRRSLANFVVFLFEGRVRPEIRSTLSRIKNTVQAYIGGLGIVIVFLAVINSLGLFIIGVKYPIFWGTVAGLLAVIPYIGTMLGGVLPVLYSLATADSLWQPLAIVIFYGLVQFLEGNIITPKIIGDKVNINPLVAIVALVIFGQYWGIGGVILALPLTSIIRIILSQFEETESVALLMSSTIARKPKKFEELADG